MAIRKIIHIDMDAFYASVEQRDFPELRNKPIAVGYPGLRGVVATCSYEARKYGIRSAMPSQTALKLCPRLIFTPPRFEVYKQVSQQIRNIFEDYTDVIEPLSLDEAFLDVTVNKKDIPSAIAIASEIKQRIAVEIGLTASAGVSINKFVAKVASDYQKPNGLFVVKPSQVVKFVESLEIERFFGVGKVTAEKMRRIGIRTGGDLKAFSVQQLTRMFGKSGTYFYQAARGIDNRPVYEERTHKSMGAENTFFNDIDDYDEMLRELETLQREVFRRMMKHNFYGKTVTIKIKFNDFHQITRSKTITERIENLETLRIVSESLLHTINLQGKKLRLIGITVSNSDYNQTEPYQQRFYFQE